MATAILSAREEGKLLRELLSPDRFESSTSGGSELATELGANQGQIEKALSVLPAKEIRQLHGELGQDLFEQLLKKDQKVIHDFSRTLDLAGNDTAASNAIAETLRLNKKATISNDDLGKAISNLVNFMERYQGKVFGDFASRFSRELYLVKKRPDQALQARGEIKAAEDFLEGTTPLGSSRRIEGLAESKIQGVQTPEFRVTGADGITRLAEVKTIVKPLEEESISRNLRKAISQIKEQIQAGEGGAYIRLLALLQLSNQ